MEVWVLRRMEDLISPGTLRVGSMLLGVWGSMGGGSGFKENGGFDISRNTQYTFQYVWVYILAHLRYISHVAVQCSQNGRTVI